MEINLQLFAEENEQEQQQIPSGHFKWYDPQAKKEILIPEKVGEIDMKVILGHVTSGTRTAIKNDLEKKYETKLQELNSLVQNKEITLSEFQEKLQKFEDEKLTNEQKIAKELERERNKYSKEIKDREDQAKTWESKFKSHLIENEILKNLPPNVYNFDDTALLIKNLLKPEVVTGEKGDEIYMSVMVDGEEQKLKPKEAIQVFLAQPGRENLLKNNLVPGAGSSKSGARLVGNGLVFKRSEVSSNPKIREEYYKKIKEGIQVSMAD